jgi:hypothetical protein
MMFPPSKLEPIDRVSGRQARKRLEFAPKAFGASTANASTE